MNCRNTKITIKCPNCTNNKYQQDNHTGETYCTKCGLIIQTPYPYTAGNKHKTLSDFQIEQQEQKTLQRMMKIWKKTI